MEHSYLLYNIPIFIISLSFILVGSSVLIRKKPLIFSYRWFVFALAFLFMTPGFDNFSHPVDMSTLLFPMVMLVFLGYIYFIMKGVMVLGADGDDFQKSFISVLTDANYTFEQTFASIKIADPALEISIAFQSWVGSGQIRMRNKENKETFDNIIRLLKTKEMKTNLITPVFYLIFGAIMLLMESPLWKH